MKNFKKVIALVLVLSLFVMSLVGCSNASKEDSSNTSKEENNTSKEDSSNTSKEENKEEIIKIGQSTDILSFDPHKINDMNTSTATRHIYSGLIKLNQENKFVGDLAESWENTDDKTVVFKLRSGVKFHNGDTLTSADVKFSLERQMASSSVGHLVKVIDSVEVIDDLNVKVNLKEPTAVLISGLAHVGSSIVNKKHVEELEKSGKSIDSDPVGTGAYKFKSFKSGDSTVLTKFDDYFGDKAANSGIEIKVIPDGASRTIALETGEIDLLTDVDSVDVQKIKDNSDLNLIEFTATQFEHVIINNEKAPFDNVKVRQAINHAVNKESIIKVAANGQAQPADSYIGKGAIGYSSNVTVYDYNIEKAKELLTEAGYSDGFEAKILVFTEARNRSAQVLQAALSEIGITLKIEMMEKGAFYEKVNVGDFDMAILGWVSDAEPNATFNPLFNSSNIGATGNRARYKNPEVDDLLLKASVEVDMDKRMALYEKLQQIVTNDAVLIPLYYLNGILAKRANLEGLIVYPISTHRYDQLTFTK